jgi:hypothetical protein
MHHLKLSVVAEFAQFELCRPFIDAFESGFGDTTIIRCEWARYAKFPDSYQITWYLLAGDDPGLLREVLRERLGARGWSTHIGDGHLWNRPPGGAQSDGPAVHARPASWAHLLPMSDLAARSMAEMARGPDFDETSPPFVSVSTDGEVTGEFDGTSE